MSISKTKKMKKKRKKEVRKINTNQPLSNNIEQTEEVIELTSNKRLDTFELQSFSYTSFGGGK